VPRKRTIFLHREITGAPKGFDVDHADGDSANNQRGNLRVCTHAQNMGNRRVNANNTSGFKGVSWKSRSGRWLARLAGKDVGLFETKELAAAAYQRAALAKYGEFARW
jgi:hypothetical protein